jgi:hypothetical protein
MIETTRPEMSVREPLLFVAFELGKKDRKLALTSGFGVEPWGEKRAGPARRRENTNANELRVFALLSRRLQ